MRRVRTFIYFMLPLALIAALAFFPTPETIAVMKALADFSHSGPAGVLAAVVFIGGTAAGVAHCGITGALVGLAFAAFVRWVPRALLYVMMSAYGPSAKQEVAPAAPPAVAASASFGSGPGH